MNEVDRKIVEQEVSQMFDEHKTFQGVVEALLIETGWDANTIRAAQEARQRKQQLEDEKEAKREAKKKNKKSPQALIQQLAEEQKQSKSRMRNRGVDREGRCRCNKLLMKRKSCPTKNQRQK